MKTITDERVLDIALEVLLERGPHRFTLPDIGCAVGLSPSTLIQRFGSKRELLDAVLRRATEQLQMSVEATPLSEDPRRELLGWMVEISRALRTREHVASNLALLIEDLSDEPRRLAAARHVEVIRQGIEARLRALESPSLALHVDMVEAHWHGLIIQWALHGEGEIEAWISTGLEALLDALGLCSA